MADSKNKKGNAKKEMSEGRAIMLAVFLFTVAIIAGYFILKFILEFFFPGLLS